MALLEDWRHIIRHAWSVRWMAAAFVFGLGEALTAALAPPDTFALRVGFAVLTAVCSFGALVSRLMVQRELSDGR